MKSYWISKTEQGTVLEARVVPVPRPGPGQVVVRMHATSINRGDILASISRHSAAAGRPAGVDGAGVIHALGEGVKHLAVGDRVMVRAKGAFAEYAVTDATLVTPMPASMSFEHAAAIPVAYITAYEAVMQLGRLRGGEWLLIAGASSGVGVAALQAAKMLGARVIGVSSSAEKLARLKAMGLDVGIPARGAGFANEAVAATDGKGVDLAVNLVGGTAFPDCIASLADFGRLAVVGYVDGLMKAGLDLESVHGKRLQIFGVSNAPLSTAQRATAQRGFERELLPALADGRIVPVIDRVFDFEETAAAKAYVERNALLGKVVIRIP
ncbi:MAG: quinone oxidoreductase family protein [Rhodospirillaceae bacterium]